RAHTRVAILMSVLDAILDYIALKFCERCHDAEQELSCGGPGVNVLLNAHKLNAAPLHGNYQSGEVRIAFVRLISLRPSPVLQIQQSRHGPNEQRQAGNRRSARQASPGRLSWAG